MFHVKLKYLRERSGLSRKELAKNLNVTYTTIANYETNERQPDLLMLKKLALFFNVSVDYLLDIPFTKEQNANDLSIYLDAIKSIVKYSEDVYFKDDLLNIKSKVFVADSIDFINSQIVNINGEDG